MITITKEKFKNGDYSLRILVQGKQSNVQLLSSLDYLIHKKYKSLHIEGSFIPLNKHLRQVADEECSGIVIDRDRVYENPMKKTAKFYATHPEARKKHQDYQKSYNKKPREVAKRVELNRENRKRDGYHDGMDLAHTSRGLVKKSPSANRGSKTDRPGDRRARG